MCSWHEPAARIAWAEILLLSGPINWLEVDFTYVEFHTSFICKLHEGGRKGRSVILCR